MLRLRAAFPPGELAAAQAALAAPPRWGTVGDDAAALSALLEEDPASCRAWVLATRVPLRGCQHLQRLGITPARVAAWARHQTVAAQTYLVGVLAVATLVHEVDTSHLDGWLQFAADQRLRCPTPSGAGWRFLGGQTALFAAAGLTPAEATRLVDRDEVDAATLHTLARLRGHPQPHPG